MPLIATNLLRSIYLLANAVKNFSQRCIQGLKADRKRCEEMIEKSLALATALTPQMGYEEAARIAKKAYVQHQTIRQVVEEERLLSGEDLGSILNPRFMISPSRKLRR
jgi:fumarate hydratase class II